MAARLALVILSALALGACNKAGDAQSNAPVADAASSDPAAEVVIVKNLEAQVGDTTTCPFSGRRFEVKADHPRVEFEGNTYWVCSEEAAESVRADPAKYLADFEG